MMLRHDLRTDAQICGKSATQASIFVHHGRDVNRVYYYQGSYLFKKTTRYFTVFSLDKWKQF